MARKRYTLLIAALVALTGCKDPVDCCGPVAVPAGSVIVACEGQYGTGNSAISSYDPTSGNTIEDLFLRANGYSIGDVLQSISRSSSGKYFACVNNSDRIAVLDPGNFAETATIPVTKPRYMLEVNPGKAYVTSLFSKKVFIINPATQKVTGSIDMPYWNPEGLVMAGGKVYIACWDTATAAIFPIDTANDQLGAGISIAGRAPQEILADKEGMLWVLSGNQTQGAPAFLTRLNPATGATLKTYSFGTADPMRPAFNAGRDTLYFIEVSYSGGSANGIYRMGIHDAALPAAAFVPAKGLQYYWGLGVHPASGNIYVADPLGFTQRGKVRIYRPDGQIVDSFATGVGPGHFYFF